jgi:formate hydrogenlyase transcriptional activator
MPILDLVGSSKSFRSLLDDVEMIAPVDSAVLIQGETGTGKEVIARAIHEASPRRRNRFVALNCAAIPSSLLESELFGHEKGAFTGAVTQTVGRFQAADRGTLFLDEIGDLPLELQPKLLRALQEKQFERLGGRQTLQIDVRVIAATNQDLGQMILARKFRADLYYRLNVFPIALPPLRERRADIPLLAEHFVEKFARQQGKVVDTIPDDVMAALEDHDWPGNIRELQNVIERGVVMTAGPVLSRKTTEHLRRGETPLALFDNITATSSEHANALAEGTPEGAVAAVAEPARITTLADAARAHITATLRATSWVVGGPNGAAAQLGLPRTTLLARMQRLGISSGTSRSRRRPATRGLVQAIGGLSSRLRDDSSDGLDVTEAVAG